MKNATRMRAERAHAAAVVAVLLLVAGAASAEAAFPFENVDFWVGEGTNRATVVVDWGRDDASAVLA